MPCLTTLLTTFKPSYNLYCSLTVFNLLFLKALWVVLMKNFTIILSYFCVLNTFQSSKIVHFVFVIYHDCTYITIFCLYRIFSKILYIYENYD